MDLFTAAHPCRFDNVRTTTTARSENDFARMPKVTSAQWHDLLKEKNLLLNDTFPVEHRVEHFGAARSSPIYQA